MQLFASQNKDVGLLVAYQKMAYSWVVTNVSLQAPATHRPPDQQGRIKGKAGDDRLHILRPRPAVVVTGRAQRFIRLPMATQVRQDQPKPFCQLRLWCRSHIWLR